MYKTYIFNFQNKTYRMSFVDFILKGYDALLMETQPNLDYDEFIAAHRVEDNTWYVFSEIAKPNKPNVRSELYTTIPASVLTKALDYLKSNDMLPAEEQHPVYAARQRRLNTYRKLTVDF